MRIMALTLALLGLPAHAFNADEELQWCENYAQMEQKLRSNGGPNADGCGAKGYLINYGRLYCRRFVNMNRHFTPSGQQAMYNIRHCLVGALQNQLTKLNCQNVRKAGIDSHFNCYMQSGYCNMPTGDMMNVYLYLADSAGWESMKAGGQIFMGCRAQRRSSSR